MRRFAIAALALSLASATRAQYDPTEDRRRALKGIRSYLVTVDNIDGGARLSLSSDEIQTKAELTLRGYGIPVSSKSKDLLRISIIVLKSAPPALTVEYNVLVTVKEPLRLPRTGDYVLASIWQQGYLGVAGEQRVHEEITKAVANLVEMLVNDHLAVNSKPPK